MTRKRFIKLQMSRGYDRNGAVALAAAVRAHGMTYADACAQDWPRGVIAHLADHLTHALAGVADWVNRVARAARAAGVAFSKAMEEE